MDEADTTVQVVVNFKSMYFFFKKRSSDTVK